MGKILFFVVVGGFFLFILLGITSGINIIDYVNYICFSLTSIYSIYNLTKGKYAYSLQMFFWLFVLFFLGVIPLIQYAYYTFPWTPLSPYLVLKGNLAVLSFIFIYSLTYNFFQKIASKATFSRVLIFRRSNYNRGLVLFLIAITLVIYGHPGLTLFLRSKAKSLSDDMNNSLAANLLLEKLTRSVILYFLLYTYYFKFKVRKLCRSVVYILSFLTNFPIAIARYSAASFYLGFILTVKNKIKNTIIVPSIMIIVLALIFPLLSLFRFAYVDFEYIVKNHSEILGNFWISPDFDAFSMLCRTIDFVQIHGITFGNQLLGVLLFLVPRSFWPDKPVGSGYLIAQSFGWDFKNVSCPIMAEGYINFGLIGIFIFATILAIISSKYDRKYWEDIEKKRMSYVSLLYPAFLGLFFFMLRGDLLSSYAYICGLYVPSYLLHKILNSKS